MNEGLSTKLAVTLRGGAVWGGAILVGAVLASCGAPRAASTGPAPPPSPTLAASSAKTPGASLQDRLARELLSASPPADPADAKARDAAGERLARLDDLVGSAGERLLWGGFDPSLGYDPKAQRLTAFNPLVWAKVYLSTFMFAGPYQVRREGRFTLLEIGAAFRAGLDSGDYPYPFWHSAQKWQAYLDTRSLILVFEGDRLIATYRRSAGPTAPLPRGAAPEAARPAASAAPRAWDGRFRWTAPDGGERPRVALFTYLLSADNPALGRLDHAYRTLEESFRRHHCVSCHAPDNQARANPLLLLDYPNQALAARHSLITVLRGNQMPPADPVAGHEAGLADAGVRQELLVLAEQFEREADAALAFEAARRAGPAGAGP
jgi:hypothetical protein